MRAWTGICLLLLLPLGGTSVPFCGHAEAQEAAAIIAASPDEPVHRVLFESGFYRQALEYLNVRLNSAGPVDSAWQEYQKYRAFCLILVGEADSAQGVFEELLAHDSTFTLDRVRTSPKIFEVFHAARAARFARPPAPVEIDTAQAMDALREDTAAPVSDSQDSIVSTSDSTGAQFQPSLAHGTVDSKWYRIPARLLPGGVGQFLNGQPAKGAVLLGAQALTLGASIVTFRRRAALYDDRFGWYEGNMVQYERYTAAYRIEFGVFAFAYLYSVVDACVVRARRAREQRESNGDRGGPVESGAQP